MRLSHSNLRKPDAGHVLACYYFFSNLHPFVHVMPLIMDDGLDDLFGEGPTLQLPESIPKGLLQRVDEQNLSGCCQYVPYPRPESNILRGS